MLTAEYLGLKEMHSTHTIRVPQPICAGEAGGTAYAVFEYLDMGGRGTASSAKEMGRQLARMHQCSSQNGQFGFHVDNSCGATLQPNGWTLDWAGFWDKVWEQAHVFSPVCR